MKKSQGFGAIGILVAIAAILILGAVAWKAWDATKNQAAKNIHTEASKLTSNSLTNGDVTFSTPEGWSVESKDAPSMFVGSTAIPADGINAAVITPSKSVLNSYKEPFKISVSVYKDNGEQKSPREWYEKTLTTSLASDSGKTSEDKINDYDAYTFEQINDSYHEYNYVLRHNGLFVYISWRPSEAHYTPQHQIDNQVDNTVYNPEILKMIESIKIK